MRMLTMLQELAESELHCPWMMDFQASMIGVHVKFSSFFFQGVLFPFDAGNPQESRLHGSSGTVFIRFGGKRSTSPTGFHMTAREPKRAHLTVQAFKTPKFHEKTREGRKNENCGGRGKKARFFWRSVREGRRSGARQKFVSSNVVEGIFRFQRVMDLGSLHWGGRVRGPPVRARD